ncbi:hypothetical protein ILUMI_06405 [Ignelater luminosus]|uniref:Uncharacterized protein n=1 Tax=Ignelater luminosus TaxID=2038154 RepID=A0A8K0D5U3_IGNLU|nr:hypothetical protein ILUMI_06405 [Ignelater luminosus]
MGNICQSMVPQEDVLFAATRRMCIDPDGPVRPAEWHCLLDKINKVILRHTFSTNEIIFDIPKTKFQPPQMDQKLVKIDTTHLIELSNNSHKINQLKNLLDKIKEEVLLVKSPIFHPDGIDAGIILLYYF